MTQIERILRHIAENGSITAAEAMNEYGIMRLAARMGNIRAMGYDVCAETVKGKNRFDEPVRFTRYSIRGRVHD